MTTLANFPMKDQLTEPAGPLDADGRNDNPRFNCVATSFAAAIQYLTGKTVRGEELKDAAYGDKYQGGTSLSRYIDSAADRARALYGVTATPYNSSDTAALIRQARTWLRQGFPVIATIPSAWGTAHSEAALKSPNFSTHVVCFNTENGTAMGAMNPWGGFQQNEPDSWWEGRLCYGQVWKIYKQAVPPTESEPNFVALDLQHSLGYFSQAGSDTGKWNCSNGKTVMGAILAFYRSFGFRALCGLSYLGLPLTLELAPIAGYNGRVQVFERGAVAYDPQRKFDNPPGVPASFDPCYTAHIEGGPVFDALVASIKAQLKQAEGERDAAKASLATAQSALAAAQRVATDAAAAQQLSEQAAAAAQAAQAEAEAKLAEVERASEAANKALQAVQMAKQALDVLGGN